MNKLREICSSPWFLIAAQILLSAAVAVGAVFYTYATVIVYCLWKIALIEAAFALCCGALFCLAYFEKDVKANPLQLIFSFVIGVAVFMGLFFALQVVLSIFVNETVVCVVCLSVALGVDVACVIAQDVFAARRDRMFLRFVTVAVVSAVYVGAMILSCLMLPHGWVFKSFSDDTNEFATASAEAYELTDTDRAAGKTWLIERLAGETPAFDFRLGGKRFGEELSSWSAVTVKEETDENGDLSLIRTYAHVSGVEARVEAKYYDLTATVEWTVYVTNHGAARSEILSDLYPLDASLPVSSTTLYFSGGSNEANDDFALYSRKLGKKEYVFDTVKGRTSMLYLPFFNLCGKEGGATVGIGWSGEWTASFSAAKETHVRVGQSVLEGQLEVGETVRTPLVSLCFYEGDNAMKGFNAFRADIKRGLGDRATESSMLMFAGAEGQDDTSRATAAGTKAYIEKLDELGVLYSLDYAWYDAGWYDTAGTGDWRQSIGDWKVDPVKYPDGFKAVSSYLQENGVKTLLWYEPERVPMASNLYKEITQAGHTSWLIDAMDGSTDCLWNMGDDAAREFMTQHIISSLKENGVKYYRQDFNIDPKAYWKYADRSLYDLRKGFAENKYVTGEYAFLDALSEAIPGLLIDNCASGGRRIDLEMCRRAVPLWRSDYQCKKEKSDLSEAAQYQLYGLGMWLPYSCITNPNAATEYDFRSLLGGNVMFYGDVLYDASDTYVKFIREYEKIKTYFAENYYPLTSCTPRSNFVAMQFGTAQQGTVLAYVRSPKMKKGSVTTVYPSGLSPDKLYEFRYIEGDLIKIRLGKEIMQNGITVPIDRKEALVITYHEA